MPLSRLLHRLLLLIAALLLSLPVAAETIRFAFLELDRNPRYDDKRTFFRTLSQPFGAPFAGAEVALREARFVGQALKVEFALDRVKGADAKALLAQVEKLQAEGVRFFLVDAPAEVVAELAQATRGKELLLFNVAAADDALRQAQCQPHLFHTIPNHAMQTDAMAQYLVSRKWREVLLLEGPLPGDRLLAAAFEA